MSGRSSRLPHVESENTTSSITIKWQLKLLHLRYMAAGKWRMDLSLIKSAAILHKVNDHLYTYIVFVLQNLTSARVFHRQFKLLIVSIEWVFTSDFNYGQYNLVTSFQLCREYPRRCPIKSWPTFSHTRINSGKVSVEKLRRILRNRIQNTNMLVKWEN